VIDDNLAPEIRTNPHLPPGWQLIDGPTGQVAIAEADALAVVRSWLELEAGWSRTQ
jgi:hypothetical protein